MEAGTQTTKEQSRTNGAGEYAGTVEEVQGVVVEVAFPAEHLPEIYNALEITMDRDGEQTTLVLLFLGFGCGFHVSPYRSSIEVLQPRGPLP